MAITDTQILSHYYKRALSPPKSQILISSITAAEFLLIQSKSPHKANYYPILPSRLRQHGIDTSTGQSTISKISVESKKHAAFGKYRTDQLLLNFGGRIPSLIEFGSIAISKIINESHDTLFASSISHLDKELQKKLRARFDFLIRTDVQCVPVTPEIATVGMNLLARFLDKYEAKQNLRNTINDILILSTAIQRSSSLHTEDSLLGRFAIDFLGANCQKQVSTGLQIDFSISEASEHRRQLESKGYINRGWQIMERRGR